MMVERVGSHVGDQVWLVDDSGSSGRLVHSASVTPVESEELRVAGLSFQSYLREEKAIAVGQLIPDGQATTDRVRIWFEAVVGGQWLCAGP